MARPRGNPAMVRGGPSLNPSGKDKNGKQNRRHETIAAIIDRVCSPGAEEEIAMLALAARGLLPDPENPPDPVKGTPGGFVRVGAKERVTCANWIAEQRHGKARQGVDLDVRGGLQHTHATIDLGRLEQGELGDLERLLAKGAPEELIEGEVVDGVPSVSPDVPDPHETAPQAP